MKSVDKKSNWEEFREAGLLWYVNLFLHAFGWALKIEMTDGKITNVYPDKVSFRGFPESSNTNGYRKITQHLKENMDKLIEDTK